MVDAAEYERWRDLNLASMFTFFSFISSWTANGELVKRDGMVAAVSPDTRYSSIFNSVIYDDPRAVEAELDNLAARYEGAGIKAWTVWVPDRDRKTAEFLEAAGHKLDTSPRIMGRELEGLEPHSMEGIDWTAQGSAKDVCQINDAAYGLPEGIFEAGFGLPSPGDGGLYVAHLKGDPAASVMTLDVGSDLGIYAVATHPDAQGRGLSTALMRQAMADGRDRGLKTTSLQASAAGRPVYDRLGYGDFGCFEMWERREPKPEG